MIPRNIFLMWDKSRTEWPAVVRLCVEMWERLNPEWTVRVVDAAEARSLIVSDVRADVYDSLRVQMQSDLVRTKLLATDGGVWADATVLPHRPLREIAAHCEDADLAAMHITPPGRLISNWLLASGGERRLASVQYDQLCRYWRTPKMMLPQSVAAMTMIEERWRDYMSDHAAHTLRIAPYFLWHYLYTLRTEVDATFGGLHAMQPVLLDHTRTGQLQGRLAWHAERGADASDAIAAFFADLPSLVSKLNWRHCEGFPFDSIREATLGMLGIT